MTYRFSYPQRYLLFHCIDIDGQCNKKLAGWMFTHFPIDHPLPGDGYGTGGFGSADLDRDGDLDITIRRRSDTLMVCLRKRFGLGKAWYRPIKNGRHVLEI